MRYARWLAVSLALLTGPAELRAQGFFAPAPFGIGNLSIGGSFSFGRTRIHLGTPYFGGYPYGYLSGNQVTVFYYSPPPPQLVVIPAPAQELDLRDLIPPRPQAEVVPRQEPPPVMERPLPGAPASVFRFVGPNNRALAQRPVPPDNPAKAPEKPPEKPKAPPKPPEVKQPKREKPPELPLPPGPELDPQREYARQVALGKEAFANQGYGRAAQRFRQANAVAPNEPLAHFLLAQAQVALGKYREAVLSIEAGLRLQPDWPTAQFRPLELYGDNVVAFPEHLRHLEDTLARHADDPVLLFLYAYELWFDGRKDEAWPLFQKAAEAAPGDAGIQRFLGFRPAVPLVMQ